MADGNAPTRVLLRKILYRIDFQLITEKIQEELFEFVTQEFEKFFSYKQQELENSIGIEINAGQIEQSKINQRAQPVFVFAQPQTPECDGRELKIGRTFLLLEVSLNLKTMGISYYEWFSKIVEKLREKPMFRLSRIGLRKFNSFFVLDSHRETLNNIFIIDYLSEAKNERFILDSFEKRQVYNNTPYTMQFSRAYSSGNLKNELLNIQDEPAHMIAFDFDLFTTDLDEMSEFVVNAKTGLEKMNNLIYDFFTSVIREDVVKKINQGDLLEDYHVIPF